MNSKMTAKKAFLYIGLPIAVITVTIIAIMVSRMEMQMPEPAYDTPQYTATSEAPEDIKFDDEKTAFATAEDGVTVIPASIDGQPTEAANADTAVNTKTLSAYAADDFRAVETETEGGGNIAVEQPENIAAGTTSGLKRSGKDISDRIWADDNITTYNSFTETEVVKGSDNSLGALSIPKIGLDVTVYETVTDEIEAMQNGVAHFNSTSAWDGNVGLCGHNATNTGTGAYFKNLHQLKNGDAISYTTSLGTRNYTVTTVKNISETDWNSLSRTDDNRITLITCVNNDGSQRLLVQGTAN